MPSRAEALADQFEAANNEAITTVEAYPETKWKAATPNDGRPVNALAYHIAASHDGILGLVQALANGQQISGLSPGQLDQMNAEQAQQHANTSKVEVIDLLRQNGATAAAAVRGLSDDRHPRRRRLKAG
jgi:hypothetical protein